MLLTINKRLASQATRGKEHNNLKVFSKKPVKIRLSKVLQSFPYLKKFHTCLKNKSIQEIPLRDLPEEKIYNHNKEINTIIYRIIITTICYH